MKTFLAILVGTLVGLLVQAGTDIVTQAAYPAAITDVWDLNQISQAYAARPAGALLLSLLSFFLAGLAGAATGRLIGRTNASAWIPAGVIALEALLLALNFPIPAWTGFATIAGALFGGLAGNHLAGAREIRAR